MSQKKRAANCPIDVFVASNMPYEYPYKLVKPRHVTQTIVDSADTVIMDSGIGDELSNCDVLDYAEQYNADIVIAKDYLHNQPLTTESVKSFLQLWNSHDCNAMPLIPLQPPHSKHYQELPGHYHYCLGGLAAENADIVIDAVESFRDVAGDEPYVHLLGVGANAKLLNYVARNPGCVQSIDCSTPEQCAINGKIYDVSLQQQNYQIRTGNDSRLTRSGLAQHLAYTLCDAIRLRYENQDQTELTTYT